MVLTWDQTLTYAYVFVNGVLNVELAANVTTTTVPYNEKDYIEVIDSNDQNSPPDPNDYPKRRITIQWQGVAGAALYRVYVDTIFVRQIPDDGRIDNYSFTSSVLSDSIEPSGSLDSHTITVSSVDSVGNESTTSELNFDVLNEAPPTTSVSVNQTTSGAGKIDMEVGAPVGW